MPIPNSAVIAVQSNQFNFTSKLQKFFICEKLHTYAKFKNNKKLYEKLSQMPDLHSFPELDEEIF